MNAPNLGADWQMQIAMEEQEQRVEEILRKIYDAMVPCGDLKKDEFRELVYLTGVRAKFE